jgi:4a-hydroxytetrahydrobiopterin dehydratase
MGMQTGRQGDLKDQHCVPVEKGAPALNDARIAELLPQLNGWKADSAAPGQPRSLRKEFSFPDFLGAIAFVNKLAALAEEEQHHPDVSVRYSRVEVSLWTHTVGGLSENDFILAAKLDSLF